MTSLSVVPLTENRAYGLANDMEIYDPDNSIDQEAWVALDEGEREYLVEQYHRKKRIKVPNMRMHAMLHVVVENQIALGDSMVR